MLEDLERFVLALWHVVGLVLLVVLFAEFGIDGLRRLGRRLRHGRAWLPDRAATADAHGGAEWPIAYFDEFKRAMRVEWRPYVEWWQRPARGEYINIDARGLRPTPGEDEAAPGAVHILCFGGSTMFGMGARDPWTIPAVLARRLKALGHTAAVTNCGQMGHNSTQEVITLQQLLKRGVTADIALFYDGANEMLAAEQTGRPDRLYNENHRVAEFNLLNESRRGDLILAALMALLPRTLRRLRSLTGLRLHGPLPQPDADLSRIDIPQFAAEVVDVYAANLRLARLLAREHGMRTLFFWQPTIATKRDKSADEQRAESAMTRDVGARRRLYTAILAARRAHREIAGADDTVDLSAVFDDAGEPVYIDAFHLSEAGNAAIAAAMLPRVVSAIEALAKRSRAGSGPCR
jgi:lysophospholipase L1-like esterase